MEGVPKSEVIKSPENTIEVAKELHDKLRAFDGAEVVGSEAIRKVELLAQQLSEVLKGITAQEQQKAGLPWHPYENLVAANDDQYNYQNVA